MDHEKHNSMVSLAGFGYSDFSSTSHSMAQCFNSSIAGSSRDNSFMVSPEAVIPYTWQQNRSMMVDDPSLRCLFPVEQQSAQEHQLLLYAKPTDQYHSDARFFPTERDLYQQPLQLKSSKYMVPAQQLLSEFCSLGMIGTNHRKSIVSNTGSSSSSSGNQYLHSQDVIELQKRKASLLTMLEELDGRYRKYYEQMRCVVSTFEATAGEGTASVYSVLASKAMSRHFRSLRDAIVAQIKVTNKAMGSKDMTIPGASRGQTPRLRFLDQCLRQQRASQQAGIMESQPWRPQRGLPERAVTVLRAWLFEHFLHPYPSDVDKHILARQTGLSRSQVSNWFINARVRLWKPMVEEMYVEETKKQDNLSDATVFDSHQSQLQSNQTPNPNSSQLEDADQKPTREQPPINDSDSLSSIINSRHRQPIAGPEKFGVMEMDFSSYNEGSSRQNFGNSVSLTLGLQQHNEGGLNPSFSPSSQTSHFFSRVGMDDCQPVQFEIIGGEGSKLPYRNLMGAQIMHDLAG